MFIPERTVDSLFAVDVVRHDPYVLVWSPTQYRRSPDHVLSNATGRVAIFECKGVQPVNDAVIDRWTTKIDVGQLAVHAGQPHPVLYLLLAKPPKPDQPAGRYCHKPCCAIGGLARGCKKCPRDPRSWALLERHVATASIPLLLQPWFAHWAWTIPAADLYAWVTAHTTGASMTFTLDDAQIDAAFPTAARLCHRLHELTTSGPAQTQWTWPPEEAADALSEFRSTDDDDATPVSVLLLPDDS